VACWYTLSPVVVGGAAYFVGWDRKIQMYKIGERKWEVV